MADVTAPSVHRRVERHHPPITLSPVISSVVSAAATPLGNLSFSTSINCRLSGTARQTPRSATETSQAAVSKKPSWRWARSISAGTALISPAPAIAAAAEAAVCMVLFSSTVKRSSRATFAHALNTTHAVMAEVIDARYVHPMVRPV